MNLTTDPWIPIVWDDGKPGMVSLADAFSQGQKIHDLAVRPHERVALMRLLICVAQAALDGPVDYEDWKTCQPRLVPAALDYLKHWQHAFELFGNGQRFLQVSNLKKKGDERLEGDEAGNSVSKLDVALATGNNSTVFDNAGGTRRAFSDAQLALNLLTFQCFSPGGRIGVARWGGKETLGEGSSNHAPCLADGMLHALVRGGRLLETIYFNLLSHSQVTQLYGPNRWGQPVWERWPDNAVDANAIHNATATYVGRLVPFARAVRLDENGHIMILANGLAFPTYPEWREPTATVVVRHIKDQPTRILLRASLGRAPWRELHSLTVKAISQTSNGGPLTLRENVSDDQPFDLWVGGLVADQAKLLDTVESVFHVPAAMLTDSVQRTYEAGVKHAASIEFRLRRAVSAYHGEVGDNLNKAEMHDRRKRVQDKATSQFWTDVECHVSDLLAVVADPATLGLDNTWHKTAWGQATWSAVLAAYDSACPRGTARQIRAHALGRKTLFAAPDGRNTKQEVKA